MRDGTAVEVGEGVGVYFSTLKPGDGRATGVSSDLAHPVKANPAARIVKKKSLSA